MTPPAADPATNVLRRPVEGVFTGAAEPLARGEASAIRKLRVRGRVAVGPLGLAGDEQADRAHHGGSEQAVHLYPADHYPLWRADHPAIADALAPGSLGENLSVTGVTEGDALIGDVLRLGSALLQVSQGRQPCWKIDARFGVKGLTAAVLRTGRSGWYFRVLEPGSVEEGDELRLVDRPAHGWTVRRVTEVVLLGRGTGADAGAVAGLDALTAKWRARAAAHPARRNR